MTAEQTPSPLPEGGGVAAPTRIDYKAAEETWAEYMEGHGPARPIIDAILALSEEEAPTTREDTLPVIRLSRVGAYNGRRYRVVGYGLRATMNEVTALHPL